MGTKGSFSRRKFIERSLVGVAGAGIVNLYGNPLFGKSPGLPFAEKQPGQRYKIGIVGCGNRSKAILNALNGVPDIEVAALCDIVPHKLAQRAELIKQETRSEEHTSELQSLMRHSYAGYCLKQKTTYENQSS